MNPLDSLAAEIAAAIAPDDTVAIDPATLLLIGEVIIQLVSMLKACNKTAGDAVQMAKRPLAVVRPRVLLAVTRVVGNRHSFLYCLGLTGAVIRSVSNLSPENATSVFTQAS